jgi:hypothetical protein
MKFVSNTLLLAVSLLVLGTNAPYAMADYIDWGAGYNYAMVVGNGAKELDLNGQQHLDINANFGIGSGTALRSSGPANIVGSVSFGDALANNCNGYGCTAGSAINNTTITG